MKITRDNYESWFLDYLEERLPPEQEEMVRQFAAAHPDLAEELDPYAPILTADRLLVYPGKEKLKKVAYHDHSFLGNQVVALMENDLAEADRLQLETWLANHPDQYKEAQLQYKCRLHPDQGLLFPHKHRLKRKATLGIYLSRIAAVAAILLLAFLLFGPTEGGKEPASPVTVESVVTPSNDNLNDAAKVTGNPPLVAQKAVKEKGRSTGPLAGNGMSKPPVKAVIQPAERREIALTQLAPRSNVLQLDLPLNGELAPLKTTDPWLIDNIELPVSDILRSRALALKASDDHELFSRNKVVIAGLNFFSKLTGSNLTGKKGRDGRLRTISFNTQLLAFSIPVNREL